MKFMAQDTPVIIIFDSGLGGTSILKEIISLNLSQQLIYVADNQYLPYGLQTKDFIEKRVCEIFSSLNQQYRIEAAVIACNTATSYAANSLRSKFKFPIVAMEPGIKPAINLTKNNNIGILATEGTIKSSRFISLVDRFTSDQHKICIIPGVGLVEEIESQSTSDKKLDAILLPIINQLLQEEVDTLVLGCTHYPLIKNKLKKLLPEIQIVDTTKAVLKVLNGYIDQIHPSEQKTILFMTSKDEETYLSKIKKLTNFSKIEQIEFVK
jgi:glutamate racemase